MPADLKEYLYKVLVVGDIATGKTSIIKRYVHNIFSMHYKATVSASFYVSSFLSSIMHICVSMCVCVRRMCASLFVFRVCVCVHVRACMRALCTCVCACVCVHVRRTCLWLRSLVRPICICRSFHSNSFYRTQIGVDFALKVINLDPETVVRLQLWDIAGQERFGNMTRVYYKEAVGAIIVFDVTRVSTMEAVSKWKMDLDQKVTLPDGSPLPVILLANKCDLAKEGMVKNSAQMDRFCEERGFVGWFETSAKENINIDKACKFLVQKILENDRSNNSQNGQSDSGKIDLNDNQAPKSGCCG
eukprot:Opistho-1_new@79559